MRRAFTLIELMVAISILSIMMLFLYKGYASLNISNNIYKKEVTKILKEQIRKKEIYLDFSVALTKSIKILKQDNKEDVVFMQTRNSLHHNYNPYVAYIMKEEKLYRLESLKPFKEYPLSNENEFSVDYLGEVKSFRTYKSSKKVGNSIPEIYLVDVDFKKENDILIKIKVLNES